MVRHAVGSYAHVRDARDHHLDEVLMIQYAANLFRWASICAICWFKLDPYDNHSNSASFTDALVFPGPR